MDKSRTPIIFLILIISILSINTITGYWVISPTVYAAQSSNFNIDIDKVVNFLKSRQAWNGGFHSGSKEDPNLGATILAVHTLYLLNRLDAVDKSKILDYMLANKNHDHGYSLKPGMDSSAYATAIALLLYKMLNYTPSDLSKSLDFIIKKQNIYGGWGSSISHDTFYVLWCLKEYNYYDKINLRRVIDFISSLQADDGGFYENYEGTENRIHATTFALIALDVFLNAIDSVDVEKALKWLRGQQRANGGFPGAGGHTFVAETCEAVLAVRTLGREEAIDIDAAVNYIFSRYQESNDYGYWTFWGDPVVTYTAKAIWIYLNKDGHYIFNLSRVPSVPPSVVIPIEYLALVVFIVVAIATVMRRKA